MAVSVRVAHEHQQNEAIETFTRLGAQPGLDAATKQLAGAPDGSTSAATRA